MWVVGKQFLLMSIFQSIPTTKSTSHGSTLSSSHGSTGSGTVSFCFFVSFYFSFVKLQPIYLSFFLIIQYNCLDRHILHQHQHLTQTSGKTWPAISQRYTILVCTHVLCSTGKHTSESGPKQITTCCASLLHCRHNSDGHIWDLHWWLAWQCEPAWILPLQWLPNHTFMQPSSCLDSL